MRRLAATRASRHSLGDRAELVDRERARVLASLPTLDVHVPKDLKAAWRRSDVHERRQLGIGVIVRGCPWQGLIVILKNRSRATAG